MSSDMTFNRTSVFFCVQQVSGNFVMESDMTLKRTYIYIFILEVIFLSDECLPVGVLHGVFLLMLTSLFGFCFLCAQCSQCDPVGDNLSNNTLGLPLYKIMNSS